MANLSSNGANYQHSGLDNLRANETDFHATVISESGPVTNKIAAAYQKSGTEMLRSQEKDIHAEVISAKAGVTIRAQAKPARVDSFHGNIV